MLQIVTAGRLDWKNILRYGGEFESSFAVQTDRISNLKMFDTIQIPNIARTLRSFYTTSLLRLLRNFSAGEAELFSEELFVGTANSPTLCRYLTKSAIGSPKRGSFNNSAITSPSKTEQKKKKPAYVTAAERKRLSGNLNFVRKADDVQTKPLSRERGAASSTFPLAAYFCFLMAHERADLPLSEDGRGENLLASVIHSNYAAPKRR